MSTHLVVLTVCALAFFLGGVCAAVGLLGCGFRCLRHGHPHGDDLDVELTQMSSRIKRS